VKTSLVSIAVPKVAGTFLSLGLAAGIVSSGTLFAEPPRLVPSHGPIVQVPQPPAESAELTWKAPPAWKATTPTNQMRKAQYALPAAAGDPPEGECVVFYFGAGQGGDVKANVDRWRTMFSTADGSPGPSKVGEIQVGGRTITRVEASGTYTATSMGPGSAPPPPKPDWMMLGAVVPGADANWFFRCTGPKKTIEAERAHFDALLASIR
jgi:hypothetical protein